MAKASYNLMPPAFGGLVGLPGGQKTANPKVAKLKARNKRKGLN